MLRFSSLRIAAAVFAFSSAALTGAVPASAQTIPGIAGESTYAAALRTINPKLPLEKARAYARSVMADAWRTHLDPRFIMSIVTLESAWHANAVSRVGARGLGQLMPATAATLGVNPRVPSENLRGTSNYLATLMTHFAGKPNAVSLAIAGYNAGPRAVERFHGIPPYAETQHYVVRVLRVWNQLNARIGRAFAPAGVPAETLAKGAPDVRQWVSDVNAIVPAAPAATAPAATEAAPAPAAVTSATPGVPAEAQQPDPF